MRYDKNMTTAKGKPMPNDDDFENIRKAYSDAWDNAKRCGDEALDAIKKADLVRSQEARDLFKRKASRAMTASENWRKSSDRAVEMMQKIAPLIPRDGA
jgi:hypothetical protein